MAPCPLEPLFGIVHRTDLNRRRHVSADPGTGRSHGKVLTAVDAAYEFAVQSGAEIVLLHVIERIEHVQFEFEELKPFYDRLENSAGKGLQEFSERFVANNLRVDKAIVYGQRTKEIVDFATRTPWISSSWHLTGSIRIGPVTTGRA